MQDRIVDEFWSRVHKVELTGCWLWLGYINEKSMYGTWSYSEQGKTKTVLVHRFAYNLVVGPIPDGMQLDHRCYVRFCVNPEHLEPVTRKENLARRRDKDGGARFQRSKTHCPQGHPYAGDNLSIKKDGRRACRACEREWTRQYRERNPRPKSPREVLTHCKRGHEFTPENTRLDDRGSRVCRACARDRVLRSRGRDPETVQRRPRKHPAA